MLSRERAEKCRAQRSTAGQHGHRLSESVKGSQKFLWHHGAVLDRETRHTCTGLWLVGGSWLAHSQLRAKTKGSDPSGPHMSHVSCPACHNLWQVRDNASYALCKYSHSLLHQDSVKNQGKKIDTTILVSENDLLLISFLVHHRLSHSGIKTW